MTTSTAADALTTDVVPAAAPPMPHVRTFKPRRGRITTAQSAAIDRLWPRWGFEIPESGAEPLARAELFGREAPLVLEIGCGMGEAVIAMAAAAPEHDFLAVDVHTPGLGNVLAMAERAGLGNVRVAAGDALDLLRVLIPARSLESVHVYFPDPWPKARHHKRRIIRPDAVALLARGLRPGGRLYCATDWAEYAVQMLEVLSAEPLLRNAAEGYAPRAGHRPVTKFEARAIQDGREVFDLCFLRDAAPLA
jgi:tRNA (guanine-N7-)-methyltransferase